ncbi:MAG TPA: hypothetical protein P5256_14310 [Beijerinckiaceae bacterium]|nr:hypothetical protein [Beijerinckiaceae bacterium]
MSISTERNDWRQGAPQLHLGLADKAIWKAADAGHVQIEEQILGRIEHRVMQRDLAEFRTRREGRIAKERVPAPRYAASGKKLQFPGGFARSVRNIQTMCDVGLGQNFGKTRNRCAGDNRDKLRQTEILACDRSNEWLREVRLLRKIDANRHPRRYGRVETRAFDESHNTP